MYFWCYVRYLIITIEQSQTSFLLPVAVPNHHKHKIYFHDKLYKHVYTSYQ